MNKLLRQLFVAASWAVFGFALGQTTAFADQLAKQVQIEAKFITVNQKFTEELGVDLAMILEELPPAGSNLSFPDTGNLGLGASPSTSVVRQKFFPDDEPGPIRLNGLLTQEQVDAVVAALAKDKRAKTIEAPVVQTSNNKAVQIDIPTAVGFEGVYLNVVPQIAPDGRIQMAITAERGAPTSSKAPLVGDIPVLGALFLDKKTDAKKNLVIFVTPTLIDALSPSSGGYEEGDPVKTDVVGTGETIGHIADLKFENMTDGSLVFIIPPCVIESESGKNQATFCPGNDKVELAAHQKKTVPLEGVCLEQGKPAAAKGSSDDLVMNTGDSRTGSNRNLHLPADKVQSALHLAARIYEAVDEMAKEGAYKKFPGDKEEQEQIALQWSTWMNPDIAETMGGTPSTKDDLKKVVYKQVPGAMTPEKKKKVDEGINTIFEKIELTTTKAKDIEKALKGVEGITVVKAGQPAGPGAALSIAAAPEDPCEKLYRDLLELLARLKPANDQLIRAVEDCNQAAEKVNQALAKMAGAANTLLTAKMHPNDTATLQAAEAAHRQAKAEWENASKEWEDEHLLYRADLIKRTDAANDYSDAADAYNKQCKKYRAAPPYPQAPRLQTPPTMSQPGAGGAIMTGPTGSGLAGRATATPATTPGPASAPTPTPETPPASSSSPSPTPLPASAATPTPPSSVPTPSPAWSTTPRPSLGQSPTPSPTSTETTRARSPTPMAPMTPPTPTQTPIASRPTPTVTPQDFPLGILLERQDDQYIPFDLTKTGAIATIYQKTGQNRWVPSKIRKIITVHFYQRSSEKGVCLNEGEATTPDLAMLGSDNPDCICSGGDTPAYPDTAVTKKQVTSILVNLSCEDYGAFSELEASAPGCVPLKRVGNDVVEASEEEARVKIPKDDNDNQIADPYEEGQGFNPTAEQDDEDIPPGNGFNGDGLSAYEEYRGFFSMGSFLRTSWVVKTLFIHDQDLLGFDNFPAASGFECYRIDAAEYDDDRVVNFNSGHATLVEQHGLRMVDEDPGEGYGGMMVRYHSFYALGPPKNVLKVQVAMSAGRADGPTITHELGHATGLHHHGEGSFQLPKHTIYPTSTWNEVVPGRLTHNTETLGGQTLPFEFYIGEKHKQRSGDYDCYMRYHHPSITAYKVSYGVYEVASESHGSREIFCNSPNGTWDNAGGHCGADASAGDCTHQFVVNDLQ